jgi:hypothetical protein
MGRPCFCRFCGHPAVVIAGVFPPKCEKCDGEGFWSTEPVETLIKDRRKTKRPRVPYDLTFMDRRMLKQLRIGTD